MYQIFKAQPNGDKSFRVYRQTDNSATLLGTARFTDFESTETWIFERTEHCTDEEYDSMWMLFDTAADNIYHQSEDPFDFIFEVAI